MPDTPPRKILRLADLSNRGATEFALDPGASERATLADALGIPGLRKFRFEGTMTPEGKSDWRLDARLGATAVQDCVVTLEPVTSRVDETVTRHYLANWSEPEEAEAEMPEDDSSEPLPATLDLYAVALEALSLALPAYPRAEGAAPVELTVTEPGIAPMTDEDARPFASLASLRDRLGGDETEGD